MSEEGKAPERVSVEIGKMLKNDDLTVAVAESCTGGLISHKITNVPGSSTYFDRGVVTYSNRSKLELLDVGKETLEQNGAVSRAVAAEMSEGIKSLAGTEVGLSSTGIAGPGGGTKEKPVGLVYIGISVRKTTQTKKFLFNGDRWENKQSASKEALENLLNILSQKTD